MAARAAFDNFKGVPGGHKHLALQGVAQRLEGLRWQLGKVGQGARPDLAILAIALAQENGRRRVPVRDGGDIHAYRMWVLIRYCKI